jgi:hypothetical protein
MRARLHRHSVVTVAAALSLCAVAFADDISAPPQRLSDTGLFAPGAPTQVRGDALDFSPLYPLWSDGASKRRWISLPAGAAIDASNPDAWEFPRGTKLWKEFAHGRAVETRFIERMADGTWRFAAYVWNEQGTEAELAPAGGATVKLDGNRRYTVPGEADCRACHDGGAVPVLGFSALQLSPDRDPFAPHAEAAASNHVNLQTLVERGLIKHLPSTYLATPPRIQAATPTARATLGYLHGNCGHCHNDAGSLASMELSLQQTGFSSSDTTLRTLINASSRFRMHGVDRRVAPGDAAASALAARMRSRNPYTQMPPLGTSVMDADAVALVERWIDELTLHSLASH